MFFFPIPGMDELRTNIFHYWWYWILNTCIRVSCLFYSTSFCWLNIQSVTKIFRKSNSHVWNNQVIELSSTKSHQHIYNHDDPNSIFSNIFTWYSILVNNCWINRRQCWAIKICKFETFKWCAIHDVLVNLSLRNMNVNFFTN